MVPAASPQRGRLRAAAPLGPAKKTGIAPRPVATVVAVAAARRSSIGEKICHVSQPRTHPRVPGRHVHWHLLGAQRLLALDLSPLPSPGPDAAAGDVEHLHVALALQDRGGEAAALAAAADRGDGALARDLAEALEDLAVGDVEGARDAAGLELVAVADVEHERRILALEASRQALGVDHLEALHRALLRAPGGHAAVE